jgi:hypothetical protein
MMEGSAHEDDAGKDEGGNRSYNHFYDPLDTTYGKGLSDIPQDIRGVAGQELGIRAKIKGGGFCDFGRCLRKNSRHVCAWRACFGVSATLPRG